MLRLDTALEMAEAARASASSEGISVAIVIVEESGVGVLSHRMDAAYLSAIPIATKKAFTAANFAVPTHKMAERLGTLEYQILVAAADDRLSFLKGGLPIVDDGRLVGAIGVSGGSGDQDLACCEAALTTFETLQ